MASIMAETMNLFALFTTIFIFATDGLIVVWSLWMFIDWAVHGDPQRFE
jgi:hypothetical protein